MRELDVRPNLVYLDASHDVDSVSRELAAYFALLEEPCALIGDDFVDQKPDLVRAVREFAAERGLRLHSDREKFVLVRDPGLSEQLLSARDHWRRARWRAGRLGERLTPRR